MNAAVKDQLRGALPAWRVSAPHAVEAGNVSTMPGASSTITSTLRGFFEGADVAALAADDAAFHVV